MKNIIKKLGISVITMLIVINLIKINSYAENNITKTALMIIGDTVAAVHSDRSKLYDPEFTTEFREAVKSKTHHS